MRVHKNERVIIPHPDATEVLSRAANALGVKCGTQQNHLEQLGKIVAMVLDNKVPANIKKIYLDRSGAPLDILGEFFVIEINGVKLSIFKYVTSDSNLRSTIYVMLGSEPRPPGGGGGTRSTLPLSLAA